jgi:hypothetical protein
MEYGDKNVQVLVLPVDNEIRSPHSNSPIMRGHV